MNHVLAARALYLLVFISGAALMGLQMAASRILAPSFGTSIFVWTWIIGLFMTAMALGYRLGGMLADKKPAFGLLAAILAAAGVWTMLVIPLAGPGLCQSISGFTESPLLAMLALFCLPVFLMAMTSPFSVKLGAAALTDIGSAAGMLYAMSTFGSVAGTLATAFWLIPDYRVNTVLMILGCGLASVAVGTWLLFKKAMTA